MKKLSTILFILLLSFSAQAKQYYVVLSEHQTNEDKKRQSAEVLVALTTLDAGDSITLIDGSTLQTLGNFTLPDNPKYESAKLRLKYNGKIVAKMMKRAKKPLPQGTEVDHRLRIPQILRHVAINKPKEESVDILMFGSPLYVDDNNNAFSMVDHVYPSDGHLRNPRTETPFGIESKSLMSGIRLHIRYPRQILLNERYKEFVERFWALYLHEQGGELVTFTTDTATVFDRVKSGVSAPQYDLTMEESRKIEMIRLRIDKPLQTIYERPVSTSPMSKVDMKTARDVELGLTWNNCTNCDLDIYAIPFPGAKPIYFGQTQTPEGRHLKDFRASPNVENGYETVLFRIPLDLSKLQIVVNFYEGHAQEGVKGTLRLSANGKTYAHNFHVTAKDGNEGKGVEDAFNTGKSKTQQTLMLDPVKIVEGQ